MNAQSNEPAQKTINEDFPLALPEGTILAGQYTIDKVLGQGGFGITYMATDYKTKQKVAVKEFFPDSLAYREMTTVISYPGERAENYEYGKENFLQEAKTLAEFIGCENIVRIFSYFEENGTAYFVMEYIDGVSFDKYLKDRGGSISCDEAKNILVPVMEALAIVHSKGIVHRDVTPDNIYITDDGKVKLLDFGAARYSLGDKSKSLDVILKHGFAPKEQYTRRGKQGPFTDIYSLGATFYFAVTGRRPPDSIDRIEEDELIPPSSLGVKITSYQEEAILHALEVNPQSRYQSMLDFRNVLLNETALPPQPTPVSQHFFNAPPAQQMPYTAQQPYPMTQQQPYPMTQQQPYPMTQQQPYPMAQQQPYPMPQQLPYPAPEQQAGNASKQIGDAAKQLGSAAVQLGGGVAKQIGSAAKQFGGNAAKQISSAAKHVSENAAKYKTHRSDVMAQQPGIEANSSETALGENKAGRKKGFKKALVLIPIAVLCVIILTVVGNINKSGRTSGGNPVLIGETFGNIQNGGIMTFSDDGTLYYTGYDGHTISKGSSTTPFLEDKNKTYSNLICDDDGMYYVQDGRIYYYDFNERKSEVFSKLKKYKGDDLQLYVSLDYYFVYVNGKLHRVSKDKGKTEESIPIESPEKFALCGRDLFYIGETEEKGSVIFKTPATNFGQGEVLIYKTYSSRYYSLITSDGENLYACGKDYNDSEHADIVAFSKDGSILFEFDLTQWVKSNASSGNYSISALNALGSYVALILSDNSGAGDLHFGVYTQGNNEGKITFEQLPNSNEKTYMYYYDGNCFVDYYNIDDNGELYRHSN